MPTSPFFFAGGELYGGSSGAAQLDWNTTSAPSLAAGQGRTGGYAFGSGGSVYFSGRQTMYVGLAVKLTGPQIVMRFDDAAGAGSQVRIDYATGGNLNIYRGNGSTLLQTVATVIQAGVYAHLQIGIHFHASAGWITVKVNDATIATLTGLNTRGSTNSTCDSLFLTATYYDDLWLADDDFAGDCKVIEQSPTGDGAVTGFSSSSGGSGSYTNVDDSAPNDDTDYNHTGSTGAVQTATVPALTAAVAGIAGDIVAVRVPFWCRTDLGSRNVRPVLRVGGTNYFGASESINNSYAYRGRHVWTLNPATGLPFTQSQLEAAEIGYELTS